jgi:hypothetical protein
LPRTEQKFYLYPVTIPTLISRFLRHSCDNGRRNVAIRERQDSRVPIFCWSRVKTI